MGLLKKIKKGVKGAVKGFTASGGNPWAAAAGAAATLGGAAIASHGSKKAAKQAAKAEQQAQALYAQQQAQIRSDADPYMRAGVAAQNQLNGMLGLPTDGPVTPFTESPDYQFRRTEGMRGIERTAAARGGAFSGNALRGLDEFNSGLAFDEFNQRFNRLASIAGGGQNAVQLTAGTGMQSAGMQGNAISNAGNARASGILGQYNALGQGLQDVGSIFGERSVQPITPAPVAPQVTKRKNSLGYWGAR